MSIIKRPQKMNVRKKLHSKCKEMKNCKEKKKKKNEISNKIFTKLKMTIKEKWQKKLPCTNNYQLTKNNNMMIYMLEVSN